LFSFSSLGNYCESRDIPKFVLRNWKHVIGA
jgi:hypothetical protein